MFVQPLKVCALFGLIIILIVNQFIVRLNIQFISPKKMVLPLNGTCFFSLGFLPSIEWRDTPDTYILRYGIVVISRVWKIMQLEIEVGEEKNGTKRYL